jgi:fructokinase
LGVPVGFIGGISTDFFGEALAGGLSGNGVSLAHVRRLDRPTTLAFVKLQGGEARYAFFDEGAADRHWSLEPTEDLEPEITALQFGGISLIRMPAADAYLALMLREAGNRVISFDANIRPNLVRDEADYRKRLNAFFRHSHIIKVSDADLDWIAPGADPAALAAEWLAGHARVVLLTRGGEGATVFSRGARAMRPARTVDVIDTVGAGDAFMAGFLAALHDRNWLDRAAMERLSEDDLVKALEFALAVAALTCSRTGADPPRRGELARFLQEGG